MTKNIIIFKLNVFLRDRPTVLLLLIESALISHDVMRSFLKRGVLNKNLWDKVVSYCTKQSFTYNYRFFRVLLSVILKSKVEKQKHEGNVKKLCWSDMTGNRTHV